MNKLLERLQSESVLLLDGAMGTELFTRGLVSGGSPDAWNVEAPERVQDVHKAYVDAGSNIILTNSFGGTRYRLKLHNMQDRVVELNRAAAQNARVVAFNVDPLFNNAVDGLMYIRIADLPESTVKPVMEEFQAELERKEKNYK